MLFCCPDDLGTADFITEEEKKLSGTTVIILIAFVFYLAMMIVIGAVYMKKTSSSEDYFLGGRGLNGWVAALSAQASDMSGWLLMGLPGAIYSFGSGQIWIAVGLFIGTVLNWVCISGRLRKYTIAANNSMTIPAFFENRYRDKKKILLLISSVVIVIFFLVYTASALAAGGKLFNTVFGLDYHIALAIGAAVILCYTFMGGFMAVCVTDFVQGTLMLIGLLVVPLVAYFLLPGNLTDLISQSGVTGGAGAYLNPFMNGDRPYTFIEIFSQLAWGFGYCGMPHVLVRFMAVKNEKELKKSWAIAIVWDLLSLTAAFAIAVIGRAYLLPVILGENGAASSESVFIEMIRKVFTSELALPFIGGLFLCGILAAIMSTADSQLLVTASAVSEDLYHSYQEGCRHRGNSESKPHHGYCDRSDRICHCMESGQQYYGTGFQCMGRTWFRIWTDRGNVPVLEKNQSSGCHCRYGDWRTYCYYLGLYSVSWRTDTGNLYRTLFPGSWFPAQSGDDRDRQPCDEGSIQRNHR